ncbi:hypothetical protein IR009_14140 [Pseudomonas putida]|uniref:hypothetical protein n=1 Tax=Pseudomonas putida TaxID=303 RepID=UPI0018A88F7B|nr:hypothetical protein [Pseudomonas putida]MBF8766358.1 hypothetical protein [Pseudomonas putida]
MKKIALALAVVMLTACGESKVTEVDGTTSASADQSLKAMMKGMKDNEYLEMAGNIKMLHSRYPGEEFGKALNGKDMDGFNAEVADTKKFFIQRGKERSNTEIQAHIDELVQKNKEFTDFRIQSGDTSFNPENHPFTSKNLSRIENYKQKQATLASLSDDAYWKEYGCGCYQSSLGATADPLK